MVCCVTERSLVYYTFGDCDLRDDLLKLYQYLAASKATVGKTVQPVANYRLGYVFSKNLILA